MITYKQFIQENMGTTFGEYPYQYNTLENPTDRGKDGNVDYNRMNNKFQSIQDEIKNIIVSKNPKWEETDIEKRLQEFFKLGGNKLEQIRSISDNCKDIKKCAKEIYDKYIQNIKINNGNDSINDVQQDSIMEDIEIEEFKDNNNENEIDPFDEEDWEEDDFSLDNIYEFIKEKIGNAKRYRQPFSNDEPSKRSVSFWYNDRKYLIDRNEKTDNINLMRLDGMSKSIIVTSFDDIIVKLETLVQPKDDNILGYFICDSYRSFLTKGYCKDFYNERKPKLYKKYKDASIKLSKSFYDDSDYAVIELKKNGDVLIIK